MGNALSLFFPLTLPSPNDHHYPSPLTSLLSRQSCSLWVKSNWISLSLPLLESGGGLLSFFTTRFYDALDDVPRSFHWRNCKFYLVAPLFGMGHYTLFRCFFLLFLLFLLPSCRNIRLPAACARLPRRSQIIVWHCIRQS